MDNWVMVTPGTMNLGALVTVLLGCWELSARSCLDVEVVMQHSPQASEWQSILSRR
jgi:hypothetical protein